MKRFMSTTALVALLATPFAAPAIAQDAAMTSPFYGTDANAASMGFDLRASELIGKRLYTSEVGYDGADMNDPSEDWNDVGEISDVVLAADGSSEAILLDIGGFLGIGERTVAVSMDQLKLVRDGDSDDDYFVVINASQDSLENAPEFDIGTVGLREAGTTPAATTDAAVAPATDATAAPATDAEVAPATDAATAPATDAEVAPATDPAAAPAMDATTDAEATDREMRDFSGSVEVPATEVNTDALIGANVYDVNDESVGEISELLIDDQGKVTEVILGIGGFLGIGEKKVSVMMEDLTIMRDSDDADDLSVRTSITSEQFESMEDWVDTRG